MKNIIEIEQLSFTYPGASAPTLQDVGLQIAQGDFVAIVGNNGCGKSTLCKAINGLIPHFISGNYQGQVRVDGLNTMETEIGVLAQKAGYVYQDFENQIVRPTVLDDASYACMNYAMEDYLERGREALKVCGLKEREQDYIWQLSGGQTHLLALAGAVSLSPEILILDEPIAQLDPAHADGIYQVLKLLNETYGKTILVIEHHTEYIADYCHHVVLMKDGKVRWKLPTQEALNKVEELQSCNIVPPQVTIAAHELIKKKVLENQTALPSTIEEGKWFFRNLSYRKPPEKKDISIRKEPVIRFDHVGVSYRAVKGKPQEIFRNLTLDVCRGEKIALIGSNGAGKSTLMKLITGLLKPAEGTVILKDKAVTEGRPEELSGWEENWIPGPIVIRFRNLWMDLEETENGKNNAEIIR